MSEQDNYYQDYYSQQEGYKHFPGSSPPQAFTNHLYQPPRIQSHYQKPIPHNMMYQQNSTPALIQSLGPHHQKLLEIASRCRQESSQHHHARVAASQSRMNMNIQQAQNTLQTSLQNINHPRSSDTSIGPRSPTTQGKMADWTSLDLGGMLINNLSPTIFAYDFLTCLYLNHNSLHTLSPLIANLKHMTILNVTGNKLISLPVELGLLVSLKELLAFDNQISYIPPEFGQLYQLEVLGLEGNPITDPIGTMLKKDGTQALIMYMRDICPVGPPPSDREWVILEEDASQVQSEAGQYEEFFKEQLLELAEYKGVFYPKSRARTMGEYERTQVDGCATFYKSSKFKVLESHLVEFQQVAMQRPDLRKSEDVFNRFMIKDNIAVLTLLEQLDNGGRVMVANAHLHWDPAFSDVKLIQTALLLEEVERYLVKWNQTHLMAAKNADISQIIQTTPVLICGDFNSLPDSGVVTLLSTGHVPQDHPELAAYDYSPLSDGGLSHKLDLRSCYQNHDIDCTNFTPTFKGVIDYIWHSQPTTNVCGLLSQVDPEYLSKHVGFPNAHHPSDHIPLVVSLKRKQSLQTARKVSFK